MADVRIDYQLSEHETLSIDVHVDNDRPDALDDIAARARNAFRATLEDVFAVTVERASSVRHGGKEK